MKRGPCTGCHPYYQILSAREIIKKSACLHSFGSIIPIVFSEYFLAVASQWVKGQGHKNIPKFHKISFCSNSSIKTQTMCFKLTPQIYSVKILRWNRLDLETSNVKVTKGSLVKKKDAISLNTPGWILPNISWGIRLTIATRKKSLHFFFNDRVFQFITMDFLNLKNLMW